MEIVAYIVYAVAFAFVILGVYGALPLILKMLRSRREGRYAGSANRVHGLESESRDRPSSRSRVETQLLDPSLPVFRPARPELTNDRPPVSREALHREPEQVLTYRPPRLEFESKRQRPGHSSNRQEGRERSARRRTRSSRPRELPPELLRQMRELKLAGRRA